MKYRSIWISDVHLGTKDCKAEMLLEFLKENDCEYLYLVGDIIDGWSLRRSWFWPQSHNDVIQKILRKGRKGTQIIYVPGNHDEFAREFVDSHFGNVEIIREAIHKTIDGKQFLILHGDEFDGVMRYAKWLAFVGDRAYMFALAANRWLNHIRFKCGYSYWSLSSYLKLKVKEAVQYIGKYEEAVIESAKERKVDGVICGHIHHAELKMYGDCIYANCGDWVESCTALVEHIDGHLEIVHTNQKNA